MRTTAPLLFAVISCFACGRTDAIARRDIYVRFPKGTPLSADALSRFEQSCPYQRDIVTVFDTSLVGDDSYNPHLMFWGSDLRFQGASYFASEHRSANP